VKIVIIFETMLRAKLYSAEEAAALLEADKSDEDVSEEGEEITDDDVSDDSVDDKDDSSDDEDISQLNFMEVTDGECAAEHLADVARDGLKWSLDAPIASKFRAANHCMFEYGLTNIGKQYLTSLQLFQHLIPLEIVNKIVFYTNKRLAQSVSDEWRTHENIQDDVSTDEMYAYFGSLLLLGVLRKRKVDCNDLWNNKVGNLHSIPWVICLMSRQRWKMISAYLTFDDLETRIHRCQSDRKFYKMREVFEGIRNNAKNIFQPGMFLTIDETLYPFRGKTNLRQYMAQKPAKYGLKIWMAADVESKVLVNFDCYLGKEGESVTKNLSKQVVVKLMSPFMKQGRNVTVDNFFTSIDLAMELWNNKTTLVGTLKQNRKGIPPDINNIKNREVKSSKFYFSDQITVVSYVMRKNKHVCLLSTQHHDKIIDASSQDKLKPHIVTFYNQSKGTIDVLDQMMEQYSCRRGTKKWTVRLLHFLLDQAALNAYHLFIQRYNEAQLKTFLGDCQSRWRRRFLEDLAIDLMKPMIKSRFLIYEERGWVGISKFVQDRFEVCGFTRTVIPRLQEPQSKSGRCQICEHNKDRKAYSKCASCFRWTCPEHSRKKIVCQLCE
jgi:hypothetical protein